MAASCMLLGLAVACVLVLVHAEASTWPLSHAPTPADLEVHTAERLLAASQPHRSSSSPSSSLAPHTPLHRLYGIGDARRVSVSGVSSGGFAAVQLHVIYSKLFMGAGIVAGGPYWVADANLAWALAIIADPALISIPVLVTATNYAAALASIDYPTNLNNSRVWLLRGALDSVVPLGMMTKLEDYYSTWIDKSQMVHKWDLPAQHCIPTDNWGNACDHLGPSFINNCNYSAAGEMLTHIYGPLRPRQRYVPTNLWSFEQRKFIPLPYTSYLAALDHTAYVYVPTQCQSGTTTFNSSCALMVVMHGCLTGRVYENTTIVQYAGYNEYGEANGIIMLYPQAINTLLNPMGCWDFWGYTGLDYATKLAPQMAAIKNMVDWILGSADASFTIAPLPSKSSHTRRN